MTDAPNDAVRSAWKVNARVNAVLLEHLEPAMLDAPTPGGGYTVAQHLVHLVGSLQYWAWLRERAPVEALPDLGDPERDDWEPVRDLDRLRDAWTRTADTALALAERHPVARPTEADAGGPPHETADAFLVHMLVHDAHHRGQILLALKTAGHPLPDEDALWGPWRGA